MFVEITSAFERPVDEIRRPKVPTINDIANHYYYFIISIIFDLRHISIGR